MAERESDPGASARERETQALSEQAEQEADELARESKQLDHELGEVREDWRRKRADSGVPGAPPEDPGSEEPDSGEQAGRSRSREDSPEREDPG